MGTVRKSSQLAAELKSLAQLWPLDARITHIASGREGVVTLDNPSNVPGEFDGRPTAWCVLGWDDAAVCMRWQTADVPVITWVRTDEITLKRGSAHNRPGLKASLR